MFENIPNFEIVALVALAVVGFIAVVMCVSRFLENEKENAVAKKNAVMNGTAYDTVNEELSRKFWFGYLIVAVVGAVASVAVGLVLSDLILSELTIYGESRLTAVCVGVSVFVWIVCDVVFFSRLGDSAYFATVEKKAINAFLTPTEDKIKDEEKPAEEKLTLSKEEKLALFMKILE